MRKFPLPDELVIDEYEDEIEEDAYSEQKRPGFFTTLFAILGVGDCIDRINQTHKHAGRCNGACANCPPHYGYRYGRWYYGHHHTHGCELGGGNS